MVDSGIDKEKAEFSEESEFPERSGKTDGDEEGPEGLEKTDGEEEDPEDPEGSGKTDGEEEFSEGSGKTDGDEEDPEGLGKTDGEEEFPEDPEESRKTDGEEETQPEEEVLGPFDEFAHIDGNEQYEGKEVYPEMFAPAQATNYQEFDSFFNPSYAEIQDAMQAPAEPRAIDPLENSAPTEEEAMPILDTLEASKEAANWISEAQEDEEPSIRIDPSLLRF
jgi:hypothetical protein